MVLITPLMTGFFKRFHDRDRYRIETSPLICGANQWTGFYMITASVMKGLRTEVIQPCENIVFKASSV